MTTSDLAKLTRMVRAGGTIFLASPYSALPGTPAFTARLCRTRRADAAGKAAAMMVRKGYLVFSPIVYGHAVVGCAPGRRIPCGYDFWREFNEAMIRASTGVIVLKTDVDWDRSRGVNAEIDYAVRCCVPVLCLTPDQVRRLPRRATL